MFLRRAGTIILCSTIILWALLSFPKPPAGSDISEVNYSVAGRIANTITPAFEPIGFNRVITLALIPAMAASEGAVAAIGTVYAKIGRAHVSTPVTNAQLVWRLLLEKKQTTDPIHSTVLHGN